jgi:hypothetical protein
METLPFDSAHFHRANPPVLSIAVELSMADKNRPDDIFEGPDFRMVRRGRYLEMQTNRSPEEQRALNQRMRESRPQILAEIETKTAEVMEIVRKYSSLDLIADLFLGNSIQNPNTYKESKSKLRPHWVEHATVLELKDPRYELRGPMLVAGVDLMRANSLLEEIFTQTAWYYIAEGSDPSSGGRPSRMAELRFMTLLYGMSVRSPSYASHWRDVLLGLFEHGNAVEHLSFDQSLDVRSALAIVDAIERHIIETFEGRVEKARTTREDLLSRLEDYTESGIFKGAVHEKELFDRVRNMRAKERKRYLQYALLEWTRVALGTVFSFTVERIAGVAGVSKERVQAFLSEASVGFGATKGDYLLPAPVNILHERPVIHHDSEYFCSVPHLLPWSIKSIFERILAATPDWNQYQRQRSSYLVSTALRYITNMLPGATSFQGLYYPLGTGEEAELDGLVLFDRYAFLIEGKAGSLGAARRGGPLKIKSKLEALVGDAVDQVVRAHDYVVATDAPVFRLDNGGTVTLDKARYSERALITVTLDVLDIFTADMYQMRDIGVVTTHDLPWSVALTDLRCISEIIVRAFEFTHYLRWRLATIGNPSISGGKDELNWLAIYLAEGPTPPTVPSGHTDLSFTSYTDAFDAYLLYKEGARTIPAPRPAQQRSPCPSQWIACAMP